MDKAEVITILESFRENLESVGVRSSTIILYGSYARGDWSEWSDIDVIVVSEDFVNMGYWDRIDKMVEAIYPTRAPIEAVAMTPEEWEKGDSMIAQIARDGETVFSQ
jgi:predicted nucleotidyltransferase